VEWSISRDSWGAVLRAQLLSGLQSRFDTVVGTGDPAPISGPEADAEIERLLAFLTGDAGLDVEVLHTLGLAHWLRTVTADDRVPAEVRQRDEARAGLFLMPLYLQEPANLADPVRESIAAATGLPVPQPGERRAELGEALSNLAMFLLARFVDDHVDTEGRTAVVLLRQAVLNLPVGHASHPVALCNLAYAILLSEVVPVLSGTEYSTPPPADEVVAMFRTALQHTPPGHENHPRCLSGLGEALRAKAVLAHDVGALDEAIATLRAVLRLVGPADLDDRLTIVGTVLRARALDVPELRAMLDDTAVVPVERALLQGILGEALLAGETGREHSPKVDEAVELLTAAVGGLPANTAEQALAAASLMRATMFQAPFTERSRRRRERYGDAGPEDLTLGPFAFLTRLLGWDDESSDSRHGQMMDLLRTIQNYPSGAGQADVLAKALQVQARRLEHLDPAERAEALARFLSPAEEKPPPPPPDLSDLDEVDALYDRLDRQLPADGTERMLLRMARWQSRAVRVQATATRTEDGLDQLAALVADAQETLPAMIESLGERAEMAPSLLAMAAAMNSPFRSLATADDAIRQHRAAVAADPDDLAAVTALAHALFHRHQIIFDDADFREGVALARRVVAATPQLDAQLVVRWGQVVTLRAQHDRLDPGGSGASRLMRMTRNQVADSLADFDVPGALEALENDRSNMLSQALNTRRELDALRRVEPLLADRFVALQDQFTAGVTPGMDATPERVAEFRGRVREWDALINDITVLPGFDRFLWPLPMSAADLRQAGAEGPVVAINVADARCDAIVLDRTGPRRVRLPDLHADELADQAEAFHDALRAAVSTGRPRNQELLGTLAWLWDVVAEPVLTALGHTDTPTGAWPRLWWSPTGPLNFLPLHAAGRHDTPGASVIDRVVSSYTPTLRALLHSRSYPPSPHRSALVVAMPETPGQVALPATVGEVAAILERMPGRRPLVGADATCDAVLAALPDAAVAHFACHAVADPHEPSASRLLLADRPLRITEVSKLHLHQAELAYLSACATARGGPDLADEAVHAASAFQLAGYAQVVGTQWEIADATAAEVTADFYAELAAAIDEPARLPAAVALHTVTRRLRDAHPHEPAVWAAYLHAGA
jgi:hypothetical protein